MPEKVAVLGCLGVSWFVDIQAQAARSWVSGIVVAHHFGDRAALAFAEIVDRAPVDDAGKFAANRIVVVGVAIVVRPAPRDCIDVLEDIIFRGLGIPGGGLDFVCNPADSVSRYGQVEPPCAIGVAASFQFVAQEGKPLAPLGNSGFVLIQRQTQIGPHPVGELRLEGLGFRFGCVAQGDDEVG